MTYSIKRTAQFKKDVKRMLKQGKDLESLLRVVALLQNDLPIPTEYRDHALSGNWLGKRECHIEPDWLLIYEKCSGILLLTLIRTGSHSETLGV